MYQRCHVARLMLHTRVDAGLSQSFATNVSEEVLIAVPVHVARADQRPELFRLQLLPCDLPLSSRMICFMRPTLLLSCTSVTHESSAIVKQNTSPWRASREPSPLSEVGIVERARPSSHHNGHLPKLPPMAGVFSFQQELGYAHGDACKCWCTRRLCHPSGARSRTECAEEGALLVVALYVALDRSAGR